MLDSTSIRQFVFANHYLTYFQCQKFQFLPTFFPTQVLALTVLLRRNYNLNQFMLNHLPFDSLFKAHIGY